MIEADADDVFPGENGADLDERHVPAVVTEVLVQRTLKLRDIEQ